MRRQQLKLQIIDNHLYSEFGIRIIHYSYSLPYIYIRAATIHFVTVRYGSRFQTFGSVFLTVHNLSPDLLFKFLKIRCIFILIKLTVKNYNQAFTDISYDYLNTLTSPMTNIFNINIQLTMFTEIL